MSLTSCFLVFLLCLSLHACTARRLGAVHIENNMPQNKLHTSTKVEVDGVKFKTGDKEKDRTGPGAIQTNNKHGVSVSWKVPHRKHGEKLSGISRSISYFSRCLEQGQRQDAGGGFGSPKIGKLTM
ncbi:hypothetical protein V6Z12_D12G110000 [Gossypium hirsutum]